MSRRRIAATATLMFAIIGLTGMDYEVAAGETMAPGTPEPPVAPETQEATETPIKVAAAPLLQWRFDGQALEYANVLARSPNSALNPGNTYVRLPNLALTGELRPNARATSDYVDLVFHPRLDLDYETGGVAHEGAVRGYIQEGYVRLKPTQNVSVTVGRELLTWGPAFFRSPSNPYYFNNARLDPIVELSGIDVARIAYSNGSSWTITGGGVVNSGHDLVADDAYRESLFAKADYHGPDYLGSLILATRRGQSLFTGGYAQATINDAMLAYGEFGFSSVEEPLIPAAGTTTVAPVLGSRRSATALIGGSYTFADGTSLYAEYLYNGFGFSRPQENRFIDQAREWGLQSILGGSLGGLAGENIGVAATRSEDLLGRNYIYLQYQNNPAQGNTLWRVMAAHNLTDHSTQFSAYLEQSVSDRISLFALGVANTGSSNSEFPALFRTSLMVGAKVFLF